MNEPVKQSEEEKQLQLPSKIALGSEFKLAWFLSWVRELFGFEPNATPKQ